MKRARQIGKLRREKAQQLVFGAALAGRWRRVLRNSELTLLTPTPLLSQAGGNQPHADVTGIGSARLDRLDGCNSPEPVFFLFKTSTCFLKDRKSRWGSL